MNKEGQTINQFKKLYEIDVSSYVEKKGRFSYLSWAYAWKEFKSEYPDATFIVHKFGENHCPYLKTELGYFVEVTVTANGHSETELLPVLDNHNKVIENPTAFDINTSIKRCKTKAIGLHGLGLKLWVGEDLQEQQKSQRTQPTPQYKAELPVNDVETNAINQQQQNQKPKEKNEWERKLLAQANNDEGILRKISEAWDKGIKSEKQYYFFARNLAERGFPSEIEPTVCSQELNVEKIEYDHVRGIKI